MTQNRHETLPTFLGPGPTGSRHPIYSCRPSLANEQPRPPINFLVGRDSPHQDHARCGHQRHEGTVGRERKRRKQPQLAWFGCVPQPPEFPLPGIGPPRYKNITCPRGGTGRRARFKISFPQGSGGSIPSAGTKSTSAKFIWCHQMPSRIVRLLVGLASLVGFALAGPSRAVAEDKIAL